MTHMDFEIVAERESETIRMKRDSSLIAVAKARVWASEGWSVTIVVSDEDAPVLVGGGFSSLACQPASSARCHMGADRGHEPRHPEDHSVSVILVRFGGL